MRNIAYACLIVCYVLYTFVLSFLVSSQFYLFFFIFFYVFLLISCSFFFFFSSRRRHTRCLSDWSSDVCSSDLCAARRAVLLVCVRLMCPSRSQGDAGAWSRDFSWEKSQDGYRPCQQHDERSCIMTIVSLADCCRHLGKIGRASCRERVWRSVVA